MANSINKDGTIVIDTASASAIVYTGRVRIAKIRWVGATTAGHKATLKDSDGQIIWDATAPLTPTNELESFVERWVLRDILCTVLGSGILYVSVG